MPRYLSVCRTVIFSIQVNFAFTVNCSKKFSLGSANVTQLLTSLEPLSKHGRIFLDIQAAFHRVWHHGALAKLESMGIRERTPCWFKSYSAQRKKVVMIVGETPQPQDISSGVPQGGVKGSTIFNCFTNNLPTIV